MKMKSCAVEGLAARSMALGLAQELGARMVEEWCEVWWPGFNGNTICSTRTRGCQYGIGIVKITAIHGHYNRCGEVEGPAQLVEKWKVLRN